MFSASKRLGLTLGANLRPFLRQSGAASANNFRARSTEAEGKIELDILRNMI